MVSQQERKIYEQVLERDQYMRWLIQLGGMTPLDEWLAANPWVCVAQFLEALDHCSGPMERDHIHEHAGGTKGKRAPTTMETLVILCRHHHQGGWATAHRPELREYIQIANERYRSRSDRRTA